MKLKDFKGEKGIEVVGKLLVPITAILGNPANTADIGSKNVLIYVGAFFRNNPKEVKEILAIMDDQPVETYEIDAQIAFGKLLSWFDDPELLGLFGLQSEIETSSGSAITITKE